MLVGVVIPTAVLSDGGRGYWYGSWAGIPPLERCLKCPACGHSYIPTREELETEITRLRPSWWTSAIVDESMSMSTLFSIHDALSLGRVQELSVDGEQCGIAIGIWGDSEMPAAISISTRQVDNMPTTVSRYDKLYEAHSPNKVPVEQLMQLRRIVSDGDLISKSDRDNLVERGYAVRACGFQVIAAKGITYLAENGYIRD